MWGVAAQAAMASGVWSAADLWGLEGLHVASHEVCYAFVCLDTEPSAQDEGVLDRAERARSRRFRQVGDRRRYVVSHAAMRVLLARCLDVRPEAVRYLRSAEGKPRLAPGLGPLQFSLSHSGGIGLIAVTRNRPVGVDVEQVRDVPDALLVAEQHFTAAETDALGSLPPDARRAAFLRCWTHKEAVIKATGEGLSRALNSFELELTAASVTLQRFDGLPGVGCGWSLTELPTPSGYAAAGAVAYAAGEAPPRWRALAPDPEHLTAPVPQLEVSR